jgi:hypothetical protein
MTLPKLKRIKVTSERDLQNWLTKNKGHGQDVMIVTCNKTSLKKHISTVHLHRVLKETGWTAGRSYTLDGNLVGHVVHHN